MTDGREPAATVVDASSAAAAGVEVRDVVRRFGETVALSGVHLTVPLHGRVSIVGASGCGKSTLLSLICGLDEADEGSISVLGVSTVAERLARCAWMPQHDLLLPWRDAVGNAAISLENRGMRPREARERVMPSFERLGLGGFEKRRPAQLSGGMRQRVSFLRTLMAQKEVLLLDEPFGALDSITRADVQQWLIRALDAEPRTTVLVTHDVEEAILLGHEVVVMSPRPGRIVESYTVDVPPAEHRRDVVAHPAFVALREQILETLEG